MAAAATAMSAATSKSDEAVGPRKAAKRKAYFDPSIQGHEAQGRPRKTGQGSGTGSGSGSGPTAAVANAKKGGSGGEDGAGKTTSGGTSSGLDAAPFYRTRIGQSWGKGPPTHSETGTSQPWGHHQGAHGQQAEKMANLSKEVMRLSQTGYLYLNEYGEICSASPAGCAGKAVEMEQVLTDEEAGGNSGISVTRFLQLGAAMAALVNVSRIRSTVPERS